MRERLLIFIGLGLLVAILFGLNLASYVQKETIPDREIDPNRSTYNVGATGSRALYELLAETGRDPVRWQRPPAALSDSADPPATFVVIGPLRREFTDSEYDDLLRWVSDGGRLVVIDRDPPAELIKTTSGWGIGTVRGDGPGLETDPADQTQMTSGTAAVSPVQPSIYTDGVNAVQTSRFASSVSIGLFTPPAPPPDETPGANADADADARDAAESAAPVVHLAGNGKNILADFPYGVGRITFLTDPYVVSNSGIALVDNSRLAINLATAGGGRVAFDEYHHGYGANNNLLFAYFEGTPAFAVFLQLAALIGLLLLARSRRFARPVPAPEPSRLSKLEYISAMAELQERSKGFDLAAENIYREFRRRVCLLVGVDNQTAQRNYLAKLIAAKSGVEEREVGELLFKFEDIIAGEPTNRRELIFLVSRLRDLERKLGLSRGERTRGRM